jgi:RNAse P Rpr2/Rpp21/SNM1 subunit domain.
VHLTVPLMSVLRHSLKLLGALTVHILLQAQHTANSTLRVVETFSTAIPSEAHLDDGIMASNELAATLKFLTNAGHLLAETAPETSAYIMSRRNDLLFEHEVQLSDKERQRVCTCCGHIMLPGQGDFLQIKSAKCKQRKKRKSPKGKSAPKLGVQPYQSGPTKTITCGHCGRVTEIKLPAPTPIYRRASKAQVQSQKVSSRVSSKPSTLGAPSSAVSSRQETPSQKPSASASSKKRAKSRKAGLQALLDHANASRNSGLGLGLSLADFMEKK